jgi:hypothetical protein
MKQLDESRDTCKLSTHSFSVRFERVGPKKWISSPGAEGLCNVVTVQTLENNDEDWLLWTYTSTTVTADSDEVCSKMVTLNKPLVFTWKNAFGTLRMDCQFIEFGPF